MQTHLSYIASWKKCAFIKTRSYFCSWTQVFTFCMTCSFSLCKRSPFVLASSRLDRSFRISSLELWYFCLSSSISPFSLSLSEFYISFIFYILYLEVYSLRPKMVHACKKWQPRCTFQKLKEPDHVKLDSGRGRIRKSSLAQMHCFL